MRYSRSISDLKQWLRLTQAEMGRALGVSRVTIARWESGKAKPPAWLTDALAYRGKDLSKVLDWVYPTDEQKKARDLVFQSIEVWKKVRKRPTLARHPRYTVLRILLP